MVKIINHIFATAFLVAFYTLVIFWLLAMLGILDIGFF